ncbi:LacI family transcriptional regulator [Flavobacterium sediminis]|uniref:LacI family transcriptional regulator n=1 Tax=Flavobacterium sediminis TaxID=2201181 RepID=A0A2U8QYS5_9FLAO|nr:LacI family DNA-binding transcriptional regulator [Flavobacterium sediminis]AWM15367.1 LacI family transcriptional regulator [Flavobacterium sediminis]
MKKKVTIYDIAKELNITAATVSRALNNNPNISQATRELVLKTASKMNYEQNKLALALKSGKSNNVGVIVPRIDSNFFGSVIRGIEEELNPHGYHVIICQTDGLEEKEASNIEALLNSQVDGILISTSSSDITIFDRVLKKEVPLIFFDRTKNIKKVSSVTINDFEAGYKATDHLIQTGCSKIAHFSGDLNIEIFKDRFLGYKQALLDNGIDYIEDYVIPTKSSIEAGKSNILKLLNLENPPHAVFSSSDFAALGAIKELRKLNIRIPENFSVVGFSNEPFTRFMELPITTIDQFPLEMGKHTAKVFLEQINNNSKTRIEKKVVLDPELIIRKSSKK